LRAYIDLTSLDRESDFVSERARIVDKVQNADCLMEFSEIIIGNSSRLASSARHSRACRFFTPVEWENYRSAAGPRAVPYRPPKSVERFTSKPPTRPEDDQDLPLESASLDILRRDILRFEKKFDDAFIRLEKWLQVEAKPKSRMQRVRFSLLPNGGLIALAAAAAVIMIVILALAFWSIRWLAVPI
jgi:hypothetical protein